MQAILIKEKLSFKGDTKKLLHYKSKVESCLNKVGIIESQTFGCYNLIFDKIKISVPKNWIAHLS